VFYFYKNRYYFFAKIIKSYLFCNTLNYYQEKNLICCFFILPVIPSGYKLGRKKDAFCPLSPGEGATPMRGTKKARSACAFIAVRLGARTVRPAFPIFPIFYKGMKE